MDSSDESDPEEEEKETATTHRPQYAVKVFYKDSQKKMGLKEYRTLQRIQEKPHPGIVKSFSYHQGKRLPTSRGAPVQMKPLPSQEVDLNSSSYDSLTLEYCPNSDLFELIKRIGQSPEGGKPFILGQGLTKYMMTKIVETVNHLHTNLRVAHLDLKIENVLFDKNYDIKLCDFGFSEDTSLRLYDSNGT